MSRINKFLFVFLIGSLVFVSFFALTKISTAETIQCGVEPECRIAGSMTCGPAGTEFCPGENFSCGYNRPVDCIGPNPTCDISTKVQISCGAALYACDTYVCNPGQACPAVSITGVRGWNSIDGWHADVYTIDVYLEIYGTFSDTGNSVNLGSVIPGADGPSQINISMSPLSEGWHTLTVTNSCSNSGSLSIYVSVKAVTTCDGQPVGATKSCGSSPCPGTQTCQSNGTWTSCNPASSNGISCDDSNACTSNTTCSNGSCTGGTAVTCNDSNSCTTDSCNISTGCVYATVIGNHLECQSNACTLVANSPSACSNLSGCTSSGQVCGCAANNGLACGGTECTNAGIYNCSGVCTGTSYKPNGTVCTGGTCNGSGTCVVSSGTPNLTAGSITPTSAVAGTAQTFSATVSNTGSGSTGSSFNNLFQVATAANGGGTVSTLSVNSLAAIAAGGSGTVTSSLYPFPSSGTYSVRVCADNNASWVGTITESNEGDNCGTWTNVTVSATAAPNAAQCISISTAQSSVTVGQTFSATVVMRNSGTNTWRSASVNPSQPHRLGSQSTQDNSRWGFGRVELPLSTIAPGVNATFTFNATAPSSSALPSAGCTNLGGGSYSCPFDWKMVQDAVEWFGETCTKTVTVNMLSNLTAGSITPTTAVAGTAQTFSATVSNTGSGSTGSSFNNHFQVATAANGGGTVSTLSVNSLAAIAAGGSGTVTSSLYPFPSSGTYSVRVCADNNASWVGTITESNEGDNCGTWTNVTVSSGISCNPSTIGTNQMTGCVYSDVNLATLASGINALVGPTFSSPAPISASPLPNFVWDLAGPSATLTDNFSVRWKGKFNFQAGNYVFTTYSDDGSRAYFDDNNDGSPDGGVYLVDDWSDHGPRNTSGSSVAVSAGQHTLIYEMYERTVGAAYGLSWVGTVPVTNPVVSITADGQHGIITKISGETALIAWSYSNASSCSITPPGSTGNFPADSGSATTESLAGGRTYTISCQSSSGGSAVDDVVVNVKTQFGLSVIKSGQGTVTSSPVGINCGATCNANYDEGTAVMLTAVPNSHRIFTGWGGACSGTPRTNDSNGDGKPDCTVTMDQAKTVIANFMADPDYKEF